MSRGLTTLLATTLRSRLTYYNVFIGFFRYTPNVHLSHLMLGFRHKLPVFNLYHLIFILRSINLLFLYFLMRKNTIGLTGFPAYIGRFLPRSRINNGLFLMHDYRYKGLYSNFKELRRTYEDEWHMQHFFKNYFLKAPKIIILGNFPDDLRNDIVSELHFLYKPTVVISSYRLASWSNIYLIPSTTNYVFTFFFFLNFYLYLTWLLVKDFSWFKIVYGQLKISGYRAKRVSYSIKLNPEGLLNHTQAHLLKKGRLISVTPFIKKTKIFKHKKYLKLLQKNFKLSGYKSAYKKVAFMMLKSRKSKIFIFFDFLMAINYKLWLPTIWFYRNCDYWIDLKRLGITNNKVISKNKVFKKFSGVYEFKTKRFFWWFHNNIKTPRRKAQQKFLKNEAILKSKNNLINSKGFKHGPNNQLQRRFLHSTATLGNMSKSKNKQVQKGTLKSATKPMHIKKETPKSNNQVLNDIIKRKGTSKSVAKPMVVKKATLVSNKQLQKGVINRKGTLKSVTKPMHVKKETPKSNNQALNSIIKRKGASKRFIKPMRGLSFDNVNTNEVNKSQKIKLLFNENIRRYKLLFIRYPIEKRPSKTLAKNTKHFHGIFDSFSGSNTRAWIQFFFKYHFFFLNWRYSNIIRRLSKFNYSSSSKKSEPAISADKLSWHNYFMNATVHRSNVKNNKSFFIKKHILISKPKKKKRLVDNTLLHLKTLRDKQKHISDLKIKSFKAKYVQLLRLKPKKVRILNFDYHFFFKLPQGLSLKGCFVTHSLRIFNVFKHPVSRRSKKKKFKSKKRKWSRRTRFILSKNKFKVFLKHIYLTMKYFGLTLLYKGESKWRSMLKTKHLMHRARIASSIKFFTSKSSIFFKVLRRNKTAWLKWKALKKPAISFDAELSLPMHSAFVQLFDAPKVEFKPTFRENSGRQHSDNGRYDASRRALIIRAFGKKFRQIGKLKPIRYMGPETKLKRAKLRLIRFNARLGKYWAKLPSKKKKTFRTFYSLNTSQHAVGLPYISSNYLPSGIAEGRLKLSNLHIDSPHLKYVARTAYLRHFVWGTRRLIKPLKLGYL